MSAAERFLDDSKLDVFIDELIAKKCGKGRPRELSVRALLIGLVLTSQDGRSHLTRVTNTLNALPYSTRRRLKLVRTGGITYRQVTRLFELISVVLDKADETSMDARLVHFDEMCSKMAFFSAHQDARHAPSIAIDATDIETWGTNRHRKKNNKGEIKAHAKHRREGRQVFTDPDAGVRAAFSKTRANRGAGETLPDRPPLYGYELTTATVVPEIGGAAIPFATTSLRFRPAAKDTVAMGLAVSFDHATQTGLVGDVIFDRGYNHSQDGSDFIGPLRSIGAEPVFELQPNQLGPRGLSRGALIVDGHPFSPSLPQNLQNIKPPSIKSDSAVIAAYQEEIARREQWAMAPHGSRKKSLAQVFVCPAQAGKVKCSLAGTATSRPGAIKVFPQHSSPLPDSVCTRKFSTFDFDDAPLT